MFSESTWNDWFLIEKKNYKKVSGKNRYLKKGYLHFDHRIWIPDNFSRLYQLLKNGLKEKNPSTGKNQFYAFTPFIKLLLKVPRYRYQEETGHYDLEEKIRPICYASHLDSLVFGFYSFALNNKYQAYIKKEGIDECILAYRTDTGKCNIQFSKDAFDAVKTMNEVHGGCTAVALDIKGYFDHIDHNILKEKWTKVLGERMPDDQFKLYQSLTEYSYVKKDSLFRKYKVDETKPISTLFDIVPGDKIQEKYDRLKQDRLINRNKLTKKNKDLKGIPQGSAISALLSNIYLVDYDKTMFEMGREKGFRYFRYCDDILIICKSESTNEIKIFAIDEIKERYRLTIQPSKAEIIDFLPNTKNIIRAFRRTKNKPECQIEPTEKNEGGLYKNLQYLGFEFNGIDTFVRSSSISKYFRKMKARLNKSVDMAYGKSGNKDEIFRYQIYEKYSHLGQQNFVTYAYNAARKHYKNKAGLLKYGHESKAIKRQLAKHIQVLEESLKTKSKRRFRQKAFFKKPKPYKK